ncbi:MAG: hypothetical protein ACT4PZ_19055 [Panacagrimonas sp.]
MNIDRTRASFALVSILREHVPVGGSVEMNELRQQWPRFALRRRDLDSCVLRLELLGMVEVDRIGGRQFVSLTLRGFESVNWWVRVIEAIVFLPRHMARWLSRFRRLAPAATVPRRRLTDRTGTDR